MLKYIFGVFTFLLVMLPHTIGQSDLSPNFQYEINKVYPAISITSEELQNAKTVKDLNRYFKPSWVKEYKSVKITTNKNGETWSSTSKNNILTLEQNEIMQLADIWQPIKVEVFYVPDNTLPFTEVKEFTFSFTVEPDLDASFPGGADLLEKYLRENALDHIPDGAYTGYAMSAVKFTISEHGKVVDAYIFDYPRADAMDEILLETICNMPTWQPAQYTNGKKVKQEFAFTVGNMENCMINMLNIRKLPVE